ncbi:MAG: putative lipid II flippase FtsW [Actinomycetota bacterium]|nr:putative lipid II flippase FtsW [Actinomycetota bacterium]
MTATKSVARQARAVVLLREMPTSTILVTLVAVLCVLGTIMVGSASEVVSIETYGSAWAILIRQCMWLALGTLVMVVTSRIDYRHLRRFARLGVLAAFGGLLLVLVPHLAVQATGASRWIGFGSFDVQPSEVMKLALAVFGADLVVRREEAGGGERTVIGPVLLLIAAACVLVLAEPDMGTTVVLGCIGLSLLFASGVSFRPVLKAGGAVIVIAVLASLVDPYRRQRLLSFLNPGAHASGSGYQVVQSLIGLGSGHIFGVGLGNGTEKWGFLPNPHSDFIFSVIGQELGLVGTGVVLVLLGGLCWFGLRAASRAPDRFGGLLGVTIVVWLAVETIINAGAVIGLLPVTGIPLPFISYGGSSLVVTMAGAGVLVSIARREQTSEGGVLPRLVELRSR